jgi:hypothetical protein
MGRKEVESKREDEEEDLDEEEKEETDEDEDEEGKSKASGSDADSDDDEDEDDDEEGDDLDAALSKGGKSSIYIDPWRKKGKAYIWLHTQVKFKNFLRHKWFKIVQFTKKNGEEVSFIRFENWNCHESHDFGRLSRDRNDSTLRRDHHAHICPMDKMIEWVEEEMISGRIAPSDVIFRFDDGDPEHLVELHAAGLTGMIGLENCPERWHKQCKQAKVLQKKHKPWNENLNPKSVTCFQVVDDANPTELKFAVEPPDLVFKLNDAIKAEKKRSGDDDGDPKVKPYALLWEFDESVEYGKGNSVTPQPKRQLTNKIRKLITGPKRKDQQDVIAPGNCLELRASMENAAVIDMPFDEFFKPAKQAGLMKASSQQKPAQAEQKGKQSAKDDDGDPQSDPKPTTSQKAKPAAATGKSNKEADEPEAKKPASDAASTCDFCDEEIGDDDFECGSCGTSFDQDNNYEIDGIKCKDCGTLVPVNDCETAEDASEHICPKCATVHKLMPSVRKFYDTLEQCRKSRKKFTLKFVWEVEKRHPPKEAKTDKPKGRGRKAAESDSAKIDKALGGDKIPWE